MEYILIIVAGIFVNNIVLAQFLGICPFLGVSKKVETSVGMAGAVLFVMTLATIATWLIQIYVLNPLGVPFLQTIAFILVIAALVQMVEIILKKVSPALYQALGIFLPLITTNCAVLGVAVLVMQKDYDLAQGVVYTVANALGFGLALISQRTQGDERDAYSPCYGSHTSLGVHGLFWHGIVLNPSEHARHQDS